ncbi:MAG: hypothetical protein H7296_01110 [Bacteroidia bacterium]|nr:hypothetical protein [Bacteroidia bacterium]
MEPYTETQRFNQPWLKIIFLIPVLTVLSGIIWGEPKKSETLYLVVSFAIMGAVAALLYFTSLHTRIDETGIKVRFAPYQRRFYFVAWHELNSVEIRKYKPLMEYGGWGLRYSFSNGKAFNVRGNLGLQLQLKSGKKFLIGTQNDVRLSNYLSELKTRYAITSIK